MLLAGCGAAQGTDFPDITETATPAPTRDDSGDDTTVEEESPEDDALVLHAINIMNRSGEIVGDGEVRLYAPDTLALDDASEIRLEIFAEMDENSATLFPPPSVTPVLGTPQPTPTLLPMVEAQFIEIHQFMGAGLRGLHARRFNIDPVPPTGIREMQRGGITWWKWTISPATQAAVGLNTLEVFIYLPAQLDDGTPYEIETNIIPFTIEVLAPATETPTATLTPSVTPSVTPTSTPSPTATVTPTPTFGEKVDDFMNGRCRYVGRARASYRRDRRACLRYLPLYRRASRED